MHRIDTTHATAGNLFTEGDPGAGDEATEVSADILNAFQEEICSVVESVVALSKVDNTQLLQAIIAIAQGEVSPHAALQNNPHNVTVAQIGAETPAGAAAQVAAAIATLVNSSPAALDTLNELAAALGNDANFATTMTNALATKETPAGAQAKVDTHEAAADPHPQYETSSEAQARVDTHAASATHQEVSTLEGTIAHGGTLPLPAGFTEAQCIFMVSIGDAGYLGASQSGMRCYLTGRVVTAQLSHGVSPNTWAGVSANYMVIGVK